MIDFDRILNIVSVITLLKIAFDLGRALQRIEGLEKRMDRMED